MAQVISRTLYKTTGKYADLFINEEGKAEVKDDVEFTLYTTTKPNEKVIKKATNNAKAVYGVKTEEVVMGTTIDEFVKIAQPIKRPESQMVKKENK